MSFRRVTVTLEFASRNKTDLSMNQCSGYQLSKYSQTCIDLLGLIFLSWPLFLVPLYRGHALDDWGDESPGFLRLSKGAFVTVFGVEGNYFDAEVDLKSSISLSLLVRWSAYLFADSTTAWLINILIFVTVTKPAIRFSFYEAVTNM